MDQVMWIVMFVALSLAVGMSVVAARLLLGDRRRSAARVAALEAAAFDLDGEADDVEGIDEFRGANTDTAMFAATDEPAAPSRRWLALASVAIVMAGLIGAAYMFFKPASLGASPAAAALQSPGPNPGVQQPGNVPIELLSLRHTIDGSTFTLAGLVQNPAGGAALTRVMAVVYLFDKDGAYFATGRADLEFPALRPGEESPFTIKLPVTAAVGRYRVGFRHEDGSVIAHIDKRGQPAAGLMTEGKD